MHAVRRIAMDGQAVNEGTRAPAVPVKFTPASNSVLDVYTAISGASSFRISRLRSSCTGLA